MRILFSCVGKRGYVVEYFRDHLGESLYALGTGITPWTPGFVACDAFELLPLIDAPGYIDAVLEVCARHRIEALVTLSDPDAMRLATARDVFVKAGITAVLPGESAGRRCFDKLETYRYATERGFLTPATAATVGEALTTLAFPVVVKPRFGSGSANVFYVDTPEQLDSFFGYAPDMLIQQRLTGIEVNADVLCDLQGQPRRIALWRKYRSRGGETEHAESIIDAEVADFVQAFLERFGLIGPADIDLMVTDAGPAIIEVNCRFGGGYPTSQLAGADFPRWITAFVRGEPPPDSPPPRAGVVMMKELRILQGTPNGELARLES